MADRVIFNAARLALAARLETDDPWLLQGQSALAGRRMYDDAPGLE